MAARPAGRRPLCRHDEARQKDRPQLGRDEAAGRFPRPARCGHVRGLTHEVSPSSARLRFAHTRSVL